MAGSGRRVFQPGEVLTASNVMNYLQDQAVQVYAGTAARGSAIGTAVSEGMVSYQKDTDQVTVYDGSAWKQVYPSVANAGEIVQVVTNTYSTQVATTLDTFVTTGLEATITPRSSTSKIVIIANTAYALSSPSNGAWTTIFRNGVAGTNLGASTLGFGYLYTPAMASVQSFNYLDSPATTSATTYTLAFRSNTAGQSSIVQYGSSKASITLLEVAG